MSEWWAYRPEDFLLFSPRAYWRLFELHNAASWPLQAPALLLAAALLALLARGHARAGRAAALALAVAWLAVGWGFLWRRYAGINWAILYVAPAFGLQALLLAWLGAAQDRLQPRRGRATPRAIGLGLLAYALALHPLVAPLMGRPIRAAELVGFAPDPTAIATLGLVAMAPPGAMAWLLLAIPLAWCALGAATLLTMGAPEGWVPLGAAGLAVAARLRPAADAPP